AYPDVTLEDGYRYEVMWRSIEVRKAAMYLLRDGKFVRVELPESAEAELAGRMLYVRLRDDWKPASVEYKAGMLLAIEAERFFGAAREFAVLFTPSPRVALDSFAPTKTMVVLDLLDNVASRVVEARRAADGSWSQRDIDTPKLATIGTRALDRRESDEYLMS